MTTSVKKFNVRELENKKRAFPRFLLKNIAGRTTSVKKFNEHEIY